MKDLNSRERAAIVLSWFAALQAHPMLKGKLRRAAEYLWETRAIEEPVKEGGMLWIDMFDKLPTHTLEFVDCFEHVSSDIEARWRMQ